MKTAEYFEQRVKKVESGCWEWQKAKDHNGYGRCARGPHSSGLAHRQSYEVRHGALPTGVVLMHSCNNPSCVNPDHLKPGTQVENMEHCRRSGRYPKGEAHGASKLKAADVAIIKWCLEAGVTATKLARLYGMNRWTISKIRDGETWGHVNAMQYGG